MTPVAPLVALRAMTWDAALEETLSGAAEHRSVSAVAGVVHSVHARAVNIRTRDALIALISDEFDDAPSTIRVAAADWPALHVHEGDRVEFAPTEVRFRSDNARLMIALPRAGRWSPASVDLSGICPADLDRARDALGAHRTPAPATPFGHASAALVAAGLQQLRAACAYRDNLRAGSDAIVAAVGRLIGLGEGLTPTGDDIVTGLAFVAAQPGMMLNDLVPALTAGVDANAGRTTLLSLVTLRSALLGRGRQSMHDLARALASGDPDALRDAAERILDIGHSSGADLLTGMRLALDFESRARATMPAACTTRPAPDQSALTKEITR